MMRNGIALYVYEMERCYLKFIFTDVTNKVINIFAVYDPRLIFPLDFQNIALRGDRVHFEFIGILNAVIITLDRTRQ